MLIAVGKWKPHWADMPIRRATEKERTENNERCRGCGKNWHPGSYDPFQHKNGAATVENNLGVLKKWSIELGDSALPLLYAQCSITTAESVYNLDVHQ